MKKYVKDGLKLIGMGIFMACLGIVCLLMGFYWNATFPLILGAFSFILSWLSIDSGRDCIKNKKEDVDPKVEKAKKEQERLQQEKLRQEAIRMEKERKETLKNEIMQGFWKFPAEKFYSLCRDNHFTTLDNEFSIRKATQIAEQVIKEASPEIDLTKCGIYLKKESLEEYLTKGEVLSKITEEKKILEQKKPRNANPSETEEIFINRAVELSRAVGCDKRIIMLSNMITDYDAKIKAARDGEEALKQLGMIYASQQKKETSWATMGGIAEGIAGPAAGMMVASNTIANNREIQKHNAAMRKASMDIMSGLPSLSGNRYQLEKERENITQVLGISKNKIVLSQPVAEEIWKNIKIGKVKVKKKPNGVLEIAMPISLKEQFALDVPKDVSMVVDGTIKGEVWFEDKRVDTVFFPLPMYGISSNMTAEATLDGMCGRSVEYDGEYTVKIADTQNLWIMEA